MKGEGLESKTPDVTIVGAGLVGSLLAILLSKRGMSVTVFDKRPDMRRVDISAGKSINLALAERGIAGLELAGVYERIKPQLVPMRGRMLHHEDGSLEYLPYGWRPAEHSYSVSRGALNKVLLTAAEQQGVQFVFGVSCQDIDFARKSLTFGESDRRLTVPYQRLVGADGSGSAIRAAVASATHGQDHTQMLDHGYKELSIPAGEGGRYQIEREALHIWPRGGFMLIALPNSDGSFTVTLFLQNQGEAGFASLKTHQSVQQFFSQHFADACPLMPGLADEFLSNPTGVLGTVTCWPWTKPPDVLLIGDAAHAIVPFHGQGMNCGFEDCVELLTRLDECQDWNLAAETFAQRRKPDADAIAEMALENYVIMRDSVRDPKFHLRKQLEFELERRHPDRFVPRYSMVMFHRIPYALALSRGRTQSKLLDELMAHADELDDIDFSQAEHLVTSRLTPLKVDQTRVR